MAGNIAGFERVNRAVGGAERGIRKEIRNGRSSANAYKSTEMPVESRAANTFVKFFDSISFDVDAFIYFTTRQRDEIQVRMFKFVIGILNEWSDCYAQEGVTKGTEMYRICKWANTVITK